RRAMSYSSITTCAKDQAFLDRVNACIAQEQQAKGDKAQPQTYLDPFRWAVASASDVEAAYESALAAENPNPGGDAAVITDGMILAHVQAQWDVVTAPPEPVAVRPVPAP